jgi:hypothetical protein
MVSNFISAQKMSSAVRILLENTPLNIDDVFL